MKQDFQVTKSSGQTEAFDEEKLRRSLHRAGADGAVIESILEALRPEWYEGIRTKSIFKHAFKLLKRYHRPSAARYTLKQSIFDFGPSGFPFEDFVAEIMKSQGYKVRTRQFLQGVCIQHEMDVVAENDDTLIWVECKYHPMPGSVSNVKIPLYIHSRFRDLEQRLASNATQKGQKIEGWLVTNTRFSEDASDYGRCAGMHLVGWNYPAKGSLRQLVDEAQLHPVTCLTHLSRQEKTRLLENNIVLSKTLAEPGHWSELLHLSSERRNKLMEEARELGGVGFRGLGFRV